MCVWFALAVCSVSLTVCRNAASASRHISIVSTQPGCSAIASKLADGYAGMVIFGTVAEPMFLIQDQTTCPSNFSLFQTVSDYPTSLNPIHYSLMALLPLVLFIFLLILSHSTKFSIGGKWMLVHGNQHRSRAEKNRLVTLVPILPGISVEIPSIADRKEKNTIAQERHFGALKSEDFFEEQKPFSVVLNNDKVVLQFEHYKIELAARDNEVPGFGLHWILTYRILVELVNEIYHRKHNMTTVMKLLTFSFGLHGCQMYEIRDGVPKCVAEYFENSEARESVHANSDFVMRNYDKPGGLLLDIESIGEYSMLQTLVKFETRCFALVCTRASNVFLLRENEKLCMAVLGMLISVYYSNVVQHEESPGLKVYRKYEELVKAMHTSILLFDHDGKKRSEIGDPENLKYVTEDEILRNSCDFERITPNGSLHVTHPLIQGPEERKYYIERSEIVVDPSYQDALAFAQCANAQLLRRGTLWCPSEDCVIDGSAVNAISKCARVTLPLGNSVCFYKFDKSVSENCDACIIELDREAAELDGAVLVTDVDPNNAFGIWLIDCKKKKVVWEMTTRKLDKQIQSLSGRSMDFMVGYCHPDDAEFFRRCISQGVAGASTLSCEVRMKLASEDYQSYSVVLNKQNPRYLMMLALNMNEKKKQISLMRELAETISLTLSLGKVILWFFEDNHSLSGVVTRAHLERGSVKFNWATILYNIPDEYRKEMTDAITDAIHNGRNFHIEIPIWLDFVRWVSVTAIVTGEVQYPLMGVSVDITALKDMEEELQAQKLAAEKAMAAKTRFLANMSHEVRTPLNGICGLMAVLEQTEMNDDIRTMIKVMSDAFQRLLELLCDTLDLAKMEQNKMSVVNTSFCPISLAEDIICTLAQKASANVEIKVHTDPRSGYKFFGDPYVFNRVLGNLMSNSVKFTSVGSIDITIKEDNNGLLIKIKDTGIGISEEKKQAVFEYFEQGDNSATRKYGGIGIGLTLVKKMTDLVKGVMAMESQLNVGTEFSVFLPFEPIYYHYIPKSPNPIPPQLLYLADKNTHVHREVCKYAEFSNVEVVYDTTSLSHLTSVMTDTEHIEVARSIVQDIPKVVFSSEKVKIPGFEVFTAPFFVDTVFTYCYCEYERKKQNRETPMDWESISVLAVDDNRTNRMVLEKLFGSFTCKFVIVETGRETIERFECGKFDVVLVDYYLPDINGPEVAKKIAEKSQVPIIAMTASTDRSDLAKCRESGMKYLIEKPVTIRNMKRVLKEAIMESRH